MDGSDFGACDEVGEGGVGEGSVGGREDGVLFVFCAEMRVTGDQSFVLVNVEIDRGGEGGRKRFGGFGDERDFFEMRWEGRVIVEVRVQYPLGRSC